MADPFRIFVSSSMSELPEERAAVARGIEKLGFETYLYERDANASVVSPKDQWEEALARSHVCLVIVYRKFGEWTQAEFDLAQANHTNTLVYRKEDQETVTDGQGNEVTVFERDHRDFIGKLEDVETGISVLYFTDPADLEEKVPASIRELISTVFQLFQRFQTAEPRGKRREAELKPGGEQVREAAPPRIVARSTDEIRRVARPRGIFRGRDRELADVAFSIDKGAPLIGVTGPHGIGRKALLRNFVHGEGQRASQYENGFGVSPIHEGTAELEDMLQAIWDSFYEPEDESGAVTLIDTKKRKQQLDKLRALVVIEDGGLTEDDLNSLSDQMQDSTLLVTSDAADWSGDAVRVAGLANEDDMRAVFDANAGLTLPDEIASRLTQLMVDRIGGSPYLIAQLGNRARDDLRDAEPAAIAPWVSMMALMNEEQFRQRLVRASEMSAFDAVRAAGTAVPLGVVTKLPSGVAALTDDLESGKLRAASPRYRVDPALAAAAGPPENENVLLGQLFDAALVWGDEASDQVIFENREFVLRMLDWAATQHRDADLIRLAQATDHAMAVGGRHGAWQRVLEHALDASRRQQPVDVQSEAWALHQLGSMALLRDELDDARELLHDALEKREQIGDTAGADLSRDNLSLVPMAFMSVASLILILLGFVGWLLATQTPNAWADVPDDVAMPGDDDGPGEGANTTTTTTATTTTAPGDGDGDGDGDGGEVIPLVEGPSLVIVSANPGTAFPTNVAPVNLSLANNGTVELAIVGILIVEQGTVVEPTTCSTPTLQSGERTTCTMSTPIAGEPGRDVPLTVLVTALSTDDVTVADSTSITVKYPEPLSVGLDPTPSAVRSGGEVTFEVVASAGAEVAITTVALNGGGLVAMTENNCGPGSATSIDPYRCSFTGIVTGLPGQVPVVTATVTAAAGGETFSQTGDTSVRILSQDEPSIALTTGYQTDVAGVGDVIKFQYLIVNTGGIPLESITMTDNLTGAASPQSNLEPGDDATATGTYTVTEADVEAGEIVNIATVSAVGAGQTVTSGDSTIVSLQVASIKAEVKTEFSDGVITYRHTITNTGNTPLENVVVGETLSGEVCSFTVLEPRSNPKDCESPYVPTDGQLDDRIVKNNVTLTAEAQTGEQLVKTDAVDVEFSVLQVEVEVLTDPNDAQFRVFFADVDRTLGASSGLIRKAVPGTKDSSSTQALVFELPDDWTLTIDGCSTAIEVPGPDVIKLDVEMTGNELTCKFKLEGQGIIEIEPNVLEFPPSTFSMTNNGTAEVLVPEIKPDRADFTLSNDTCSLTTLQPNASCNVTVTAGPNAGLGLIELDFGEINPDLDVSGDTRVLLIGP